MQSTHKGNYSFHIKVLNIFLLVIAILFSISLIINLLNSIQLDPQFDNEGIEYLLNIYSSTFKLGAGVIAILSVLIALKRMNQTNESLMKTEQQLNYTEKQLQLTLENTNFNNYYRHREEFIKYVMDSNLMKFLAEASKINQKNLAYDYYKFYFSESYEDFNVSVNDQRMSAITNFISELKKSKITDAPIDLPNIDVIQLSRICDIDNIHYYEITRLIKFKIVETSKAGVKYFSLDENSQLVLEKLVYIYYRIHILLEILSFSGQVKRDIADPLFMAEFEKFCENNRLQVLLLPKE